MTDDRRLIWMRLHWLVASLLCLASGVVRAEDKPAANRASALNYRRIYAPAGEVQDWPRGNLRYVPIEPVEFERLVKFVGAMPHGTATSTDLRLVRANYTASLEEGQFLTGQATLEIEHAKSVPALLSLVPCGLALSQPNWKKAEKPATLGFGADGDVAVLVDSSDTLTFQWSLRGVRDPFGGVRFDLDLPRCAQSTIELNLPAGETPELNNGLALSEREADANTGRWRLELGGKHQLNLRILPSAGAREQRPLAMVKTTTAYEFSARGVDVTSQLKIEATHEPLRQIELSLDPGLQLVSARLGEMAVPWSATTSGVGEESLVTLALPEPLRGGSRVVRLVAMAPLPVEQRSRLPRIQTRGLFWQEGTLTLLVPAPFEVKELTPNGCRQSKVGPLPAPLVGESIELQCYAPSATADVLVSQRRERPKLSTGTLIRLGNSETTAQIVADFQLPIGERFSLRAETPEEWIIDSVQSVPADAISDWSLDRPENQSRALTVRLNKALTQNHPVRLVLNAQGHAPRLGKALLPGELSVVTFQDVAQNVDLLAVETIGPYIVRLDDDDELARLDSKRLTAAQSSLFLGPVPELIAELNPRKQAWRISFEHRLARYAVEIECEAKVTPGPLVEAYRIHCRPDSMPVERLLVHFTQARSEPPQWTFGNRTQGQLTALRLSAEAQAAAGLDASGETWEIVLLRPQATPFELRAERFTEFKTVLPLSLATLPEATNQEGSLVVRSAADIPISIENRRLKSVASPLASEQEYDLTRGTYRYEPAREVGHGEDAAIRVSRPATFATPPGSFVWHSQIDSRYEPSGRGSHFADFRIQNGGRSHCSVQLPDNAEVQGVFVDELLARVSSSGGRVTFELPGNRKFVSASIQFVTVAPPLGILTSWDTPQLVPELTVLDRRTNVWLPPGYEMLDHARLWQTPHQNRLTWTDRLFGPLSRDRHQPPFDPLTAGGWANLSGGSPDRDQGHERAEKFLQNLGRAATDGMSDRGDRSLTWGSLLSQLDSSTGSTEGRLLLDWTALGEAGVWASTQLPKLANSEAMSDALATSVSLLEQTNLVLLVDTRGLLLTSTGVAAADRWQLSPLSFDATYWVLPGPLSRQMEAGTTRESTRFIHIGGWKSEPTSPWQMEDRVHAETAGSAGWTVYRLDSSGEMPGEIHIVRRATVQVIGWLVFLAVAAFGYWRMRRGVVPAGRWTVLFAVIALLAPSAVVPITSCAFLASLFCLTARLLLPPRRGTLAIGIGKSTSSARLASAGQIATLILIAVGLAIRCTAIGAAEQAPNAKVPDNVYRVFIPSDETGKPTGGRYQLPAEFRDELYRRESRAIGSPEGWLIERAIYRATLNRDATQTGLDISDLNVRFDLHVFRPETDVAIPISRAGASLVSDRALLNGRPVELIWQGDGNALICRVADAGPCRLELFLQPVVNTSGTTVGIDVRIPAVPTATLELSLPPDAATVELPFGGGSQKWSADKQQLMAQLGARDRLQVRWPATLAAGPVVDVEELLWLKVLPGSVVIDARFHLKVVSGQLRELQIAADPRLRVQPATGQDASFSELRTVIGDPGVAPVTSTVHLTLTRPVADQVTVQTSFLVTESSGIGNLRLPRLEALGVRSTRRWLAVSVDPSLESDPPGGKQLSAVPAPNFITQWGKSSVQPQSVYELPHGEVAWSLATRPRPVLTTAKQSLAVSFYRRSISVYFDAELTTTNGYTFQQRLWAPKDLNIESISLVEDGVQRAAHWSQGDSGAIDIFFNGPVTGRQQLSVRGVMPTAASDEVPLPIVRFEGDKFSGTAISVYRQRAVTVDVQDPTELADAPPAIRTDSQQDLGRLVKSLTAAGEQPTAILVLSANQPQTQVVQMLSLERQAQTWQATLDSHWLVENGTLDVLRFEIPPHWNGPFTVAPAVASQIVEIPGQNRRHLVIHPRAAIQGEYRLTVTGPLTPLTGEPVAAPDCLPLGTERVVRYVKLPGQIGSQRMAWDLTDLKSSALPEAFAIGPPIDASTTYQVVGPSPAARLRSSQQLSATPKVRLADIHLAWHSNTMCQGIATFDIEPADLAGCRLDVPPGLCLIQVYVDGLAVTVLPAGDRQWNIPFPLKPLPERVELVFAGELPSNVTSWGDLTLTAPMLVGLPVEQTLWTIYSPPRMGAGEATDLRSPSALEMDLLRLKSVTALIALPADGLSAERPDETISWLRPWNDRWFAARDTVRQRLLNSPRSSLALAREADLAKLEIEHTRIVERFGVSGNRESAEDSPRMATQLTDLWTQSFSGGRPPLRGMADGPLSTLAVRYSRPDGAEAYWRSSYALLCLALVAGWAIARRRGVALMDPLRRWPHVVGVIVGMAWWLWLIPSSLGLLIALVSVLVSFRFGLRTAREPNSTVVRLSGVSR